MPLTMAAQAGELFWWSSVVCPSSKFGAEGRLRLSSDPCKKIIAL